MEIFVQIIEKKLQYFNILFNITLEDEVKSVIQLDNNDLIITGEYNII